MLGCHRYQVESIGFQGKSHHIKRYEMDTWPNFIKVPHAYVSIFQNYTLLDIQFQYMYVIQSRWIVVFSCELFILFYLYTCNHFTFGNRCKRNMGYIYTVLHKCASTGENGIIWKYPCGILGHVWGDKWYFAFSFHGESYLKIRIYYRCRGRGTTPRPRQR